MRRSLLFPLVGWAALAACTPPERCGADEDCDDGQACSQAYCVAIASADVVIDGFLGAPSLVEAGGSARLTWSTRNAATCALLPSQGAVPRSGSLEVRPAVTTTWTLTCEGAGGPVSADATVSVRAVDGGAPDDAGAADEDGGDSDAGERDAGSEDDGVLLTGDIAISAAPAVIEDHASGGGAFLYREQRGLLLTEWQLADVSFPATWGASGDLTAAEPRCQLVSGDVLDSWLLHVRTLDATPVEGSLTFPREVVAIAWRGDTLGGHDAVFGLDTLTYSVDASRGFRVDSNDQLVLSDDRRTVSFSSIGPGIDELRILIDAAPPPRRIVKTWTLKLDSAVTSLAADTTEDVDNALLLDEGEHTLAAPLTVDSVVPGRYVGFDDITDATLPEGTVVRSWIVHYDAPADTPEGIGVVSGSATFPKPIVAVILRNGRLDASDGPLGLEGVTYPVSSLRGTELDGTDELWWSLDGRSVHVRLSSNATIGGLDQLRVLTEP